MSTPQNCCCWCYCPCSEPWPSPTSAGDPPILAGRSACLLWGHCFLPLGPGVHGTLCAPSKIGVSVSPSPVEFLQSNPAGFQSQILWGLLLLLSDSQAGKPDVGLRTFTPVGEHLWYNCFPVCDLPTWRVWDLVL